MLDLTRRLILSLYVCGPLLFVGVLLIVDPEGLLTSLRSLAGVLRTLDHRFRGYQLQGQLQITEAGPVSSGTRRALRFVGLALVACAVDYLADAGR